jgi:hypothetical protein
MEGWSDSEDIVTIHVFIKLTQSNIEAVKRKGKKLIG